MIASLSSIKIFGLTKIKSCGNEILDFYDKEILMVDSNHTCLAVINFDSALNKYEKYYLQVFLKECKNIKKKEKFFRHITEDLKRSSDDSDVG